MQAMLDEGISTRRGVMSAHREPAYQHEPWRAEHRGALAISEEISDDGLMLPLFGEMTDDDQARVIANPRRDRQSVDRSAVHVSADAIRIRPRRQECHRHWQSKAQ